MNADEQIRRETVFPRSDQIGKVFIVVGQDERKCLICEAVLSGEAAAEHAGTICTPSEGGSGTALTDPHSDAL
jgi:hypothetical protein